MDSQLTELLDRDRPRLFALYTTDEDGHPVKVFAWGMEFTGELGAQLCDAEGNGTGSFRSAESALNLFGLVHDLDLTYLA